MGLEKLKVEENRAWGLYSLLTLKGHVSPAQPGQFYMLHGDWGADPLLPRPMSVLGNDPGRGQVSFLLKVVGEGTRRLQGLRPGESIMALGPLGNGFPLPKVSPEKPLALVGGGVGVPPLAFLAAELSRRAVPFTFYQGARGAADLLLLDELRALGGEVVLTTEDGSVGRRGLVTGPLGEGLGRGHSEVHACGPEGMLRAVAGLCRDRVPCYLSLEARMGCGYGVCLGCVVPVLERGARVYRRVCKEGPVFEGEAVLWE